MGRMLSSERWELVGVPDDEESLISHYTLSRSVGLKRNFEGDLITSSV